ncbi:hypothetical protein LTR70_010702, partial [Exophiala xenobiotica]
PGSGSKSGPDQSDDRKMPSIRHFFNFHRVERGEAGRSGFRPHKYLEVVWRRQDPIVSPILALWLLVPAAIVLAFARDDLHTWVFGLSYIAMLPCASTLGLAGQELARKVPRVAGVLIETFLGSIVETILFIVLIAKQDESGGSLITVVQAAILGSILANMLLCLGFCLFIGGVSHQHQTFHDLIGGTSSDVLLVAGFALLLPGTYFSALYSSAVSPDSDLTLMELRAHSLSISRGTSIILLVSFFVYLYHNVSTHATLFDKILSEEEERMPENGEDDPEKKRPRLTFSECCFTLLIALGCVSILAYILVREIHPIVHSTPVTEQFMGLILVPLVEKLAEHITAVDRMVKNQANMAIFLCVGPSIQTMLFNTSLVVIIGWGLGKPMGLNFEVFMVVSMVLAIVVVVHFLADAHSSYLKGWFLMIVYCIIALATWYYPGVTINSPRNQQEN